MNRISTLLGACLLVSSGFVSALKGQDVQVNPGFIEGTVQIGSEPIRRVFIFASGPNGLNSQINIFPPSPQPTSLSYSLTVDVPVGTTPQYNVQATVEVDNGVDDLFFPSQPVTVAEGATSTRDFIVSNPGFIEGTVTVLGGGEISTVNISPSFPSFPTGPAVRTSTFFGVGSGVTSTFYRFPVQPNSNIICRGNVRLRNATNISLPNQTVSVGAGQTVRCDYQVDTPQEGGIGGSIELSGAVVPDQYRTQASGPTFRIVSVNPPFAGPGNRADYQIDGLAAGRYFLNSTRVFLNSFDDELFLPRSSFSPNYFVDVVGGTETPVDVSACQAYIEGSVSLSGSAGLSDLLGGSNRLRAFESQGGSSRDQINLATGAYDLVVTDGDWRPQLTTLFFRRSNTHPDGFLNQSLNITDQAAAQNPIPLTCGQTVARDVDLAFGSVTVKFTVAGGGVLSSPQLFGSCQQRDESGTLISTSSFSSSSSGQTNVPEGSVTFLGLAGSCNVTARATVNGSFVTFSRFEIDVTPGVDQEVDIGGPTLSLAAPDPGICIDADSVEVSGTATDDVEVASVVVNGVSATLTSTNNSVDPAEVSFAVTVPLPVKGPNSVVTVATDTAGKTATDTRTVFNDAGPPTVTFTPDDGDVFSLPTSSVNVSGSASDDAGIDSVTVNGQLVATTPGNPGEATFDLSVPLTLGDNSITVVATDISEKSTTVTHIVTLVENTPPVVTLSGAAAVNEGDAPSYSFAVSDNEDATFTLESASCGTNGQLSGLTSDGIIPGGGGFTCSFPAGLSSSTVSVQVRDAFGALSNLAVIPVTVSNVAPTPAIQLISGATIDEGQTVTLGVTFLDPGLSDTHSVSINWGDGGPADTFSLTTGLRAFTASHVYADDDPTATASDTYTAVVTVMDEAAPGSVSTTVLANNVAPVIESLSEAPAPAPIGTTVALNAGFSDLGVQDTHTCSVDWDDPAAGGPVVGTVTETGGSGTCDSSRRLDQPGVYSVVFTITDDDTGVVSSEPVLVVIYDPSAGFVTGGGFIDSPEGAYPDDPTLTGKANFGFVAKYKKGQSTPDGQTEFQFKAGDLNFHSSSYQWLVVAGHRAQFKGDGTINSSGDYGFLLTAEDSDALPNNSDPDRFRIKIWDKSAADVVVYDNKLGAPDDMDAADPQTIGGGSIVIHSGGGKK